MMQHYYSEHQESEFRPYEIHVKLANDEFTVFSAKGVFSKDELDVATRLLIDKSRIPDDAEVLDIGCGYGVVGIAVKRRKPSVKVTFSDVNERALRLTQMNLKSLGIEAETVKSDMFQSLSGREFDFVLANPPMSAGRQKCYELIEQAHVHLKAGGTLYIVARKRKGGEMLQKKMEDVFGKADVAARRSGFSLYISKKE